MRYSELTWFAPKKPLRRRRRLRRFVRRAIPVGVVLLAVITAGASLKVLVLDKRGSAKGKGTAHSALNPALLNLDDQLYEYQTAKGTELAARRINLYGNDLTSHTIASAKPFPHPSTIRASVPSMPIRRPGFESPYSAYSSGTNSRFVGTRDIVLDPSAAIETYSNRVAAATRSASDSARPRDSYAKLETPLPTRLATSSSREPTPTATAPSVAPPTVAAGPSPSRSPAPPEEKLSEAEAQELFVRATRKYQAGDLAGTEALCARLRSDAPDLKGVHNLLGEVYSRQRKWEAAVAEFEAALKLEPENAEYHNNLGLVLSQLNQDEQAEEHLHKASKLDPMNPTIMMNFAWHYRKLKRYPDALKYLDLALVMDPNNTQAKNKRIQTMLDMGQYDQVEEVIKTELATNPADPQAHLMMAVVYTRRGDARHAVEWLQKAEVLTSRDAMKSLLERINDFDSIKETPQYKGYIASLNSAG